jgi:chromosome condensin MukBEF MukE localization factor
MSIKEHVEEIKAFLAKFNHFIEEKKKEFSTENPDTTEDFRYHSPKKQSLIKSTLILEIMKHAFQEFTN